MRRGFTLIETILVVTLLGLLATIAVSSHRNSARKARETVLRHNLQNMRLALDQYNNDKGYYPESLELLRDEGYLREIPIDPITKSNDTWQVVYVEDYDDEDSNYQVGVFDVKSGSDQEAIDGTYYYEW
jgi:general secretion pathway protein G